MNSFLYWHMVQNAGGLMFSFRSFILGEKKVIQNDKKFGKKKKFLIMNKQS